MKNVKYKGYRHKNTKPNRYRLSCMLLTNQKTINYENLLYSKEGNHSFFYASAKVFGLLKI